MQRFVFKPQEKQAGAGEGKGKGHPSGRGSGQEQKQRAALSSLPSDTGKSGRRSPRGRPGGRGTQVAPSAGTPSTAHPQRSAPGQAGSGAPRALPARGSGGRGRAAEPTDSSARPGRAASPPRCPDPRWRNGGFGKGLPSLCVFMPLCPEGTPPPETLFPPSLRSSRRWPRRRPSLGQEVGIASWRPAEPCRPPQAGRQPPATRGAHPGPVSAAPGVGGRRKRGTMRRQPSRLAPVLGLTPAPPVTTSRRALRAKRQGMSPGERQRVRLGVEKVTPSAGKTGFFFCN